MPAHPPQFPVTYSSTALCDLPLPSSMPPWSFLSAFWKFSRTTKWRNATRPCEQKPETPDQQPAMPQLASDTNTAPQPDTGVVTKGDDSSVFALIIGIDKYMNTDHFTALRGAANDATAFYEFLVDSHEQCGLGVPESNILFLKDEDATRDKILSAFKSHFLNNARIPDHGDASMILFFAGHGTRVRAPGNLMSQDEMVEGICPVDERTSPGGQYVYTIPDYVLVHLLRELCEKKGENITVIFDSCHSGGMGRNVGQARAANSDSAPVPPELDSHLWINERPAADARLWAISATTHVWLAACAAEESAREIPFDEPGHRQVVRGRFTKSLIEHLRKVDLKNTTYIELLGHLPTWSGQTPFCGGDKRNRLLFDKKYPRTGRSAMSLTAMDKGRTWRVSIGMVAGVVQGTEFNVLDRDNHAICTLVVQEVDIATTILKLKDGASLNVLFPEDVRAVVSDWRNDEMIMSVHVCEGFPHTAALFSTECLHLQQGFVQAATCQGAHITLRRPEDEDGSVVVQRLTPIFECAPVARFSLSSATTALQLSAALGGIAHFNHFLERRNKDAVLDGVSLEVYRLTGNRPTRTPDRSVGQNGNLVVGNRALFKSVNGAKYGIIIRNASPHRLFPYLFAFDPTDYTIVRLYNPYSTSEPPLRSDQGEITIGMGGERALDFDLPEGAEKSSAFLKLFVATKALT
ncbi:Metacaspase-7 [Mycena sanguinolenta]|uniref:Metacaspase-7 n=1 Tax=Mycena sanguinolenta TaxID=230812 RepID=A0A8H6YUG1_9AGAR|nr:Metacaspase-7 [Mycena sanguinolenta]